MLKRSTGGKTMGSGRKGLAWSAVTRVARSIGGRGEPARSIKVYRCGKAYGGDGGRKYRK